MFGKRLFWTSYPAGCIMYIPDSIFPFSFTQEKSSLYPLRLLGNVNQTNAMGEQGWDSQFKGVLELWNEPLKHIQWRSWSLCGPPTPFLWWVWTSAASQSRFGDFVSLVPPDRAKHFEVNTLVAPAERQFKVDSAVCNCVNVNRPALVLLPTTHRSLHLPPLVSGIH